LPTVFKDILFLPHPVHSNAILGPLFINIFRLGHAAREGPFRHSCIISLVASVAESVKHRSGVCPSVCLSVCPIIFLHCQHLASHIRHYRRRRIKKKNRRRIYKRCGVHACSIRCSHFLLFDLGLWLFSGAPVQVCECVWYGWLHDDRIDDDQIWLSCPSKFIT